MTKESLYNRISLAILVFTAVFFTFSYALTEAFKTGVERTDYIILYEGLPYPLLSTLKEDGSVVDEPSFILTTETLETYEPVEGSEISIATVLAEKDAQRWRILRAQLFYPTSTAVSLKEEFFAAGGTPEQWEQYQLDLLNESLQERQDKEKKRIREQLDRSSASAYAAVLNYLGMGDMISYKIEIEKVLIDSPAYEAGLKEGDLIVKVNGESQSIIVLADYLQTISEKTLEYKIERDGEILTKNITPEVNNITGRYMIGIQGYDNYILPGEAILTYGEVGGSSAGIIFAITLYEYLTPEDILLPDVKYSGTGSITPEGKLVPIDGLKQKIIKAEKTGHDFFFIPKEMCEESLQTQTETMKIIPVETFSDAVKQLKLIHDGQNKQLASCN